MFFWLKISLLTQFIANTHLKKKCNTQLLNVIPINHIQ